MSKGTSRAEWKLIGEKNTAYAEYRDKVETGEVKCCNNSCSKLPDTVCETCIQYVCNEHLYRHPDCEEGK